MHESGIDYSAIIEDSILRRNWEEKWHQEKQGWDIGYASPVICDYLKQYKNKNAAILIPGCGNAYEADFMVREGFTDIYLMDVAPTVIEKLREKYKDTPVVKVISSNFFAYQGRRFDLILEQTFFCSFEPERREHYVQHAWKLLNKDGKIAGLLFNKKFEKQGPPFGGSKEEYEKLFSSFFKILKLDKAFNSIKPRQGNELFFIFQRK